MKHLSASLGVLALLRQFTGRIGLTWLLVLLETALLAFSPLLIGRAIDGLLAAQYLPLWQLCVTLATLVLVAVARRLYDTRVYTGIRVHLGLKTDWKHREQPVSVRTARLDMSRELVDFLEHEVPQLLTAVVQILVSLLVLASISKELALSALLASIGMLAIYGLVHRRFSRLNGELNNARENQVVALGSQRPRAVLQHLLALRRTEVSISDTEAIIYGLIFLLQIAFVVFNLWFATSLSSATAGGIFTVVSYSWEYVEASLMLPIALQTWSRLSEITQRLNSTDADSSAL